MSQDVTPFNSGQTGRTQREKDSLMRRIRFQDGCWIWTGEQNYAGTPVVRNGNDMVAAIDAVWAVWMRRHKPPSAKRTCTQSLCVSPNCWT